MTGTAPWIPAGIMAAILAWVSPALAGFDQPVDGTRYPTAGVLEHREYRFQARASRESGLLLGARLGVRERVQVGVFYGAQHLLDDEAVDVNPHAGFEARVRLREEARWPGVAVGFSSQGWGSYDETLERYERKSPGFFAVASKNWRSFMGDLSLHAGAGYSLENEDDDDAPDAFVAADWTIARSVSILCDVDAAWNDDRSDGRYGEGGAYVDAGVRIALGRHLALMLVLVDLCGAGAGDEGPARELEVAFADWF